MLKLDGQETICEIHTRSLAYCQLAVLAAPKVFMSTSAYLQVATATLVATAHEIRRYY